MRFRHVLTVIPLASGLHRKMKVIGTVTELIYITDLFERTEEKEETLTQNKALASDLSISNTKVSMLWLWH